MIQVLRLLIAMLSLLYMLISTLSYTIAVIAMLVNHSFRFNNETLTSCTGALGMQKKFIDRQNSLQSKRGVVDIQVGWGPKCQSIKIKFCFILIYLFILFMAVPAPVDMEVPRLGVELELQLQDCATVTAMPDLTHIWDLCSSLWQHQIPYPLIKARNQTIIITETMLGS